MSTTSSFIAGLLAGGLATLGAALFWRAPREAARRSRQLLIAGSLVAAAVVVAIAAMSLVINSRPSALAAPAERNMTDASSAAAATGMASSELPPASMMAQLLRRPGGVRTGAAEPMDEAAAGLAARLERQGGTAADWNLLAQAYDFLGRPEDARRARARAAQIGAAQRAQ